MDAQLEGDIPQKGVDLAFRPKKPAQGRSSDSKGAEAQQKKSQKRENKSVKSSAESNGPQASISESKQISSTQLPDFIIQRNELFDELKRKRDAEILEKDHVVINVVLDLGFDKDGNPRPQNSVAAKAWESTPGSFLRHVDKDISSDVVIAKVDGKELWDLDRPLERDCRVSYLPFTSAEGRNVFWHSSAHVLGEAAECQYQCLLSHGPPVEQGFFYDMALAEG